MSWVTAIWSMNAGIYLALAGVHLVVWLRERDSWTSLAFAVTATSLAIIAYFELIAMRVQTPEQYEQVLRWAHIPVALLVCSLVWFIRLYLQSGRVWLMWSVVAVRILILVLNFVTAPNINFNEITGLRHIVMFGDMTSVPEGCRDGSRSKNVGNWLTTAKGLKDPSPDIHRSDAGHLQYRHLSGQPAC